MPELGESAQEYPESKAPDTSSNNSSSSGGTNDTTGGEAAPSGADATIPGGLFPPPMVPNTFQHPNEPTQAGFSFSNKQLLIGFLLVAVLYFLFTHKN